jgi:multidrug resistance efflux pump
MIRFFARWRMKRRYRFKEESDAALADLQAGLALIRARDRRLSANSLNTQAQDIEDNIKRLTELQEKGYWLCEDGHEAKASVFRFIDGPEDERDFCTHPNCMKLTKHIRRDLMSGQEIYESDKEQKEAQKMAESYRARAHEEIKEAEGSEATAKMYRGQAASSRATADKIKTL